ncbi:hypothetical protein F5B22DRAFT_384418 [Xylaria bambusicola]|uniref:uncharacterized protein n=1 Tax=Xylaria bambusicola TaxID=326684 RepID=UPI0020077C3A|nr:uncharacterized protein F5B22DRAFT_384418 [Xylaria bambusicola]KAI0508785.1 hypothetical protein F5B22DRAFT_384418 [Xylaria bambusicola]
MSENSPLHSTTTATTATHKPISSTLNSNESNNVNERARITVPPSSAADDEALVQALTLLVNAVYSEAERGIYSTQFERTSTSDIAALLRAGELAVAYLSPFDENSAPTGCIAMKQAGPSTGEFGMLAVDPAHRGSGVGRDLVFFAEDWCRRRLLGVRNAAMRLELLFPVHFQHEGKLRLQAWYEKLGYVLIELRDFEKAYPRLFELLSGPTEFRVYEKKLEY